MTTTTQNDDNFLVLDQTTAAEVHEALSLAAAINEAVGDKETAQYFHDVIVKLRAAEKPQADEFPDDMFSDA